MVKTVQIDGSLSFTGMLPLEADTRLVMMQQQIMMVVADAEGSDPFGDLQESACRAQQVRTGLPAPSPARWSFQLLRQRIGYVAEQRKVRCRLVDAACLEALHPALPVIGTDPGAVDGRAGFLVLEESEITCGVLVETVDRLRRLYFTPASCMCTIDVFSGPASEAGFTPQSWTGAKIADVP